MHRGGDDHDLDAFNQMAPERAPITGALAFGATVTLTFGERQGLDVAVTKGAADVP